MIPGTGKTRKKYASDVQFDLKTREVKGYVAGLAFPNISESDPNAGDKVLWNYYLGIASEVGRDTHYNVAFFTFNRKGVEQEQQWFFNRIYSHGRLGEETKIAGDPEMLFKTIFVATNPQDVKGVGTFTIRYNVPGKIEDNWAYIKSARRTRRLTGNAWMDTVGGFDFLEDDVYNWNSRPSVYRSNKLLRKQWMLAVTNVKLQQDKSKAGTVQEFPQIQSQFSPAWNMGGNITYTPREVWVVEATPPSEHPYGKKIVYVDAKTPAAYLSEDYDKKGALWRVGMYDFAAFVGKTTGFKYYRPQVGTYVDFKSVHATMFMTWGTSDNGDKWDDYNLAMLDRAQ